MSRRRRFHDISIYESYSDMVLLMLALFIFLFAVVLMTSRLSDGNQIDRLKEQIKALQAQLAQSEASSSQQAKEIEVVSASDNYTNQVIDATSISRKDFEIFVQGLQDLPGKDIHLIIDATGSMHSISAFLVPILRVIVARSGKQLSAVTWYADNEAETYTGRMGKILDKLLQGAPFAGSSETLGRAFREAKAHAPAPGAYLVIGDEPSTDPIAYSEIPSPVFTMPLGRNDIDTAQAFRTLAEKTHGKMLQLDFK